MHCIDNKKLIVKSERNKKVVLLIEDDQKDADFIISILDDITPDTFIVHHRTTLEKGIKFANYYDDIDVVLMDLSLPDAMGFNALKLLRKSQPDLPIVVMTGIESAAFAEKAKKEGAQDYIIKKNLSSKNVEEKLLRSISNKRGESELFLAYKYLKIANKHSNLKPLIEEFLGELQKLVECDFIVLRLLDSSTGKVEFLSLKDDMMAYQCLNKNVNIDSKKSMCAKVIRGVNGQEYPYFTTHGSFFSNHCSRLQDALQKTDQPDLCGVCTQYGFETMAIIPVQQGNNTIGAIQIADARKNLLASNMIKIIEGFALHLGTAIIRVTSEQALIEQEIEKTAMFDNAPFIMLAINKDGRILNINKAGAIYTKKNKDELIGRLGGEAFRCPHHFNNNKICGVVQECDSCSLRAIVRKTFARKKGLDNEQFTFTVYRNGCNREISLLASTTYAPTNNGGKVFIYMKDITWQKRKEDKRQVLYNIFKKSNKAILIVDIKTAQIVNANSKACKFLDVQRYELTSLTYNQLVPALSDDWQIALDSIQKNDAQNTLMTISGRESIELKTLAIVDNPAYLQIILTSKQ